MASSLKAWRVVVPRSGRSSASVRRDPMVFRVGGAAALADGSCVASFGGTVVHATAVWKPAPAAEAYARGGVPLTVDFRHRAAADGELPGSRDMREPGRPTDAELLAARAVDRSLRPRFWGDGRLEAMHVTATVESCEFDADPLPIAANAASLAVGLSGCPWRGPVGVARVGLTRNRYAIDPDFGDLTRGAFDLLCAAGPEKGDFRLERFAIVCFRGRPSILGENPEERRSLVQG